MVVELSIKIQCESVLSVEEMIRRKCCVRRTYSLITLGEELAIVDEGSVDRDEATGWREEGRTLER